MREKTMRRHGFLHVLKVLVIVVVAGAVVGFTVMHLWNWLMPEIFGLHAITFWQGLGLFVLGKLLLGGFHHGHRGGGRGRWGREMRQRWEGMTPEERERFQAGMRGRGGRWCGPREEPVTAGTER
jgi:hypothetical protein